jgi:hypothetical protein
MSAPEAVSTRDGGRPLQVARAGAVRTVVPRDLFNPGQTRGAARVMLDRSMDRVEGRPHMHFERIRLGIAAIWMFVALFIAAVLQLSWKTAPLLLVLGLVPPIALLLLWNHPLPPLSRRPQDPRR